MLGNDRPRFALVDEDVKVVAVRRYGGEDLALHAEGGDAVGNHLLGVGGDLEDRAAQRLKRAALRLLDTA